jgi:large subunit ribosomal protein L25
MKSIEVKGNLREVVGKTTAKTLRKEDKVPCELYGQGENVHFYIAEKAFKKLVYTADAYLVNIDIDGKVYQSIIRDVQYHPVSDRVMHADFYHVTEDSPLWTMLPVRIVGSSVGVVKGGRLVQKMRKIKIKGIAKDLPEDITIDISDLDIGKSVKVKDLAIENIELMDPDNAVVVLIKTARGVAADEEEGEEGEEGEEAAAEGGDAPAEEKAAE